MASWLLQIVIGKAHLPRRCTFAITICNVMHLNYIFRKCTGDSKFIKSQEKINHLIFMDDIKLFAKNEKELKTNTDDNIQPGDKNEILHRKMCNADYEK